MVIFAHLHFSALTSVEFHLPFYQPATQYHEIHLQLFVPMTIPNNSAQTAPFSDYVSVSILDAFLIAYL